MKKGLLNLIISIIIGLAVFIFFIYKTGPDAIKLIIQNINWIYFSIFILIAFSTYIFTTLRWKIILEGYKKRIPFWTLFKQVLAGYAVSYVTPAARIGGEPVRAYMLNKESGVNIKTGMASIIIDRFVELTGALLLAILGIILLIYFPGVPLSLKITLSVIVGIGFIILSAFYYRTVTKTHSFSSIFNLFRLHKIKKLSKLTTVIKGIERRMKKFFVKNKKEFIISNIMHGMYIIAIILEAKFLLLTFGVNVPFIVVILALNVHGLATLIPVPAALGFLEAGEAGLFKLIGYSSTIGMAFSLMLRIRDILFVSIGFTSIAHFSGKQIGEKLRNKKNKI